MMPYHDEVVSLEVFCRMISERLSRDGFSVEIQPGDHLVDDRGVDSLMVLHYVLLLQELGLNIDLATFNSDLLDTKIAYKEWIRGVAARAVMKSSVAP